MDHDSPLAHDILFEPTDYFPVFDNAAKLAQETVYEKVKNIWSSESFNGGVDRPPPSIKEFVHVRIEIRGPMLDNPEFCPSIGRVRVKHRGILLTLKGTKQKYCESTSFQLLEGNKVCHDYQEIKIQESTQVLGVGAIPRSIPVILQDDLVDVVKAGGTDVRCDLEPVLVANYVRRINLIKLDIEIPDEVIRQFENFLSEFKDTPLKGRNAILRAICPQVYGLFTVKLAVALTLIGGVQHVDASGTKVRGESHLLLVGDPGTGKSQFLKFAAKLSKRSVITIGLGSTSAGLTVTAVKDGGETCLFVYSLTGEWMLEAGALVLADGGLCCIDEFDSMREHDRATIHEAKEQQTISVAKAGLVTTLSTRTIVFGATNPKGQYDPDQSLSVNTTLSGPLISRFDIVLVLLDTKNPDWDKVVSDHILDQAEPEKDKFNEDTSKKWSLSLLRRYIHFVKGYFRPTLTKEADNIISKYYQLQRRSATENSARTTVRMLESLIRLAQGTTYPSSDSFAPFTYESINLTHARLMFRNEVTRLDAITAILCIESSMTTSAIVDSSGNALHSNFTDDPYQEYAMQEQRIRAKLDSLDDIINI
ncbi:hypothetical protein L1987_55096 [Smallanthus sonchifolius]|uniref:Uncharacterized protein n=1 Tax=Smallanthus sonchifolius TaxID=185202 RepID=A0ACB9E9E8_9ASTR|nr:hypothetical protein L1987_55096 [Smallanthus sonchifolius]